MYFRFLFNDTATTEIYTLSLHDALPIYNAEEAVRRVIDRLADGEFTYKLDDGNAIRVKVTIDRENRGARIDFTGTSPQLDRKSTRLNSSHVRISYAVFCLKKKKKKKTTC